MQISSLLNLLALAMTATATLAPCKSNTKGKVPVKVGCTAGRVTKGIQAAECSHNTRVHAKKQTFAVFITDHKWDKSHGGPYGTCTAYACPPPTEFEDNPDGWTFFWEGKGTASGQGTGCIRSPKDATCGCENSDGRFVYGASSCV